MTDICKCISKRLPDYAPEMTNDELHGYIGILFILEVTKNRNVDITEIWPPNSID